MPDPPSFKRTRASVPRPRSGCKTCKRRHVKCDETKPECLKCVQTGRKCEGYAEGTPKRTRSRLSTLASALSISSYGIPFKIPGSQNDRRIFHYYCVHASSDLAGPSKADFWTRLVLQCSQDEPVVRSALLALSYEHLSYITNDQGQRNRSQRQVSTALEGLQQHHKAVRQLRRYIGTSNSPSIKAVLICCILFYHFECSRDDSATALLHLRMGLAILRNQTDPDSSPPGGEALLNDTDMQELVRTLSRLDIQASIMDTQRIPELDLVNEGVRQGITSCVGPPGVAFQTAREADAVLAKLQNWAIRFAIGNFSLQKAKPSQVPQPISAQKTRLLLQCQQWLAVFEAFESNATSMPRAEDDTDIQMYIAELRLGFYTTLIHIHRTAPSDSGILTEPSDLAQKVFGELSKLVPALAARPRPLVASIIGRTSRAGSVSRAASPVDESGGDDEDSRSRRTSITHLQPLHAARSRSASPSPLPPTIPSSRSFCAHGSTIASLFILAAKTTSQPFRDQLMSLLAQISERREGVWSAAIAHDVLVRLQDMAERPHRRLSGLDRSSMFASSFAFGETPDMSASEEGARDESEASDAGSSGDEAASENSNASSSSPRLNRTGAGSFALSRKSREYASQILDGRPFCAVAACMRRGSHAERCLWCEDRQNAPAGDKTSLEDVGARLVGGFCGFERFLQDKGGK